jgi:hypothetical protein
MNSAQVILVMNIPQVLTLLVTTVPTMSVWTLHNRQPTQYATTTLSHQLLKNSLVNKILQPLDVPVWPMLNLLHVNAKLKRTTSLV